MSTQKQIEIVLPSTKEDEANRWKALFDSKFSEKDIRTVLLLYFYLKLSGLYDHEANIFIISIRAFLTARDNANTIEDSESSLPPTSNTDIQRFYKKCPEETTDMPDIEEHTTFTHTDHSMIQFIIETLHDNIHMIEYALDIIQTLIDVYSQKDTGLHMKCMIRHTIIEDTEKELDFIKLLKGIATILEQGKQYIQTILKSKKDTVVKKCTHFRSEYTSSTKDFIHDILLSRSHRKLTMDTLLNIIRHGIYNFLFDFELIVPRNKYYKQISLHTRIRSMLSNMETIFTIMPFSMSVHIHNKETTSESTIILTVEDMIQMTYYRQDTTIKEEDFMATFLDDLHIVDHTTILDLFCRLYIHIYNGILNSIEYQTSIYNASTVSLQSKYTSIDKVHKELQSYLCSLQPADLLLSVPGDAVDDNRHVQTFFEKKTITDEILSTPTLFVCKCNLSSDHSISLEDVLYFGLRFCNQTDSGVIHHIGVIDDSVLTLNPEDTIELKKILDISSDEEDYTPVHDVRPKDSDHSYIFYIECSEASDIEEMKRTIEATPKILQQLSTDIVSFKIY